MHQTTHTTQVFTMFGGGYVSEQCADEAHWNLAPPDADQVVASLTIAMFQDIMTSLRSALSLR